MALSAGAQDTGAFFSRPRTAQKIVKPDSAPPAARPPAKRDSPAVSPARKPAAGQPQAPAPSAAARPAPSRSTAGRDTARRSETPRAVVATPSPPPPPPAPSALPSFSDSSFPDARAFTAYLLSHNNTFRLAGAPRQDMAVIRGDDARSARTNAELFYVIAAVVFFLALIRITFTKYFSDLVRAFFNPTLSQRQLREQLSQTPFPALLLNVFFTLSSGLYLFVILRYARYITVRDPLVLIPVFMGLFMVIYVVKYAFLRFTGWLFNYPEVTGGYVFTLYMVNKMLGVALLPFILVVAFADAAVATVAVNISVILIILLFAYRYVRSYALVKNQIFFNKFQFFIYLCGFEIAPVLIIGKLVLLWLNGA
jgi:hypothetical protein